MVELYSTAWNTVTMYDTTLTKAKLVLAIVSAVYLSANHKAENTTAENDPRPCL